MKLVLATRNQGKLVELRRILTGLDIVGLEEFPDAPDVPETELTFEGNALLKARAIAAHTGLPAVADDSGLCVDALNGMPGVLSARWSGATATTRPTSTSCSRRCPTSRPSTGARSSSASPPSRGPTGKEQAVVGRLEGRLIGAPRGANGFGYDPIFVPEGETRTTAELAPEEKDAISHRGKAFRALSELFR